MNIVHKNQTISYEFLQIKRVHALFLSVSFKPISVDFAFVFDMLALSAVLILFIVCLCVSFVVRLFVFRFSFCTGDVYVDFSTTCV